MGSRPLLPAGLLRGPFTVKEAREAGLNRWHLEGESWKRLGAGLYQWRGLEDDPIHRLQAAMRRLPPGGGFSGWKAAWLHGSDVPPCDPIEASVPAGAGVSARAGMALRRRALRDGDIVCVRGFRATSIELTLADLAGKLSLTEAVVIADAALHNRHVSLDGLRVWQKANAGRGGIRNLRRVIEHAEPAAESPMESRLRMVLVLGGLPRPSAQTEIRDSNGRFIGRPDLYYERHRLGIEYDGAVHRDNLTQDNRRQNNLLRAGIRLLRFTAADVLGNPASVVSHVREVLAEPATAGKRGLDYALRPAFAGKSGLSR